MWIEVLFRFNVSELYRDALKHVVKHRKSELRKIIEPQYGLLDQLVSNGVCDLAKVKVIEDTECSTLYRQKILNELAEKLIPGSAHREQVLDILKMNDQHHVAEFIEHGGCKYIYIQLLICYGFSS